MDVRLMRPVTTAAVMLICMIAFIGMAAVIIVNLPRPEHDADSFVQEWNKPDSDLEPDGEHKLSASPGLPDPKLYPFVPMAKLAVRDGWVRPRALTEGKVILARSEDDGDFHFAIEGDGVRMVHEIIPEIPLPHPKVGQRVKVWAIIRWDGEHRWVEGHPVIGIKVLE